MARETMQAMLALVSDCIKPRLVANNTVRYTRADGTTVIRLHHTDIIQIAPDGTVTLDSGGWRTITTKERFNSFAPCARVWSDKGIWIVGNSGREYVYADGMIFHPDGTVTGASDATGAREEKQFRLAVKRYAADFIEALQAGEIAAPSGADCWICHYGRDAKSQGAWGEHIREHVKESYFVPSLLVNALNSSPSASAAARHNVSCYLTGQRDKLFFPAEFVTNQIKKALRRFVLRESGLSF